MQICDHVEIAVAAINLHMTINQRLRYWLRGAGRLCLGTFSRAGQILITGRGRRFVTVRFRFGLSGPVHRTVMKTVPLALQLAPPLPQFACRSPLTPLR
jgi:hypothetical protein